MTDSKDIDAENAAAVQAAFEAAYIALDAVSKAQLPGMRPLYEKAIAEAIRKAASTSKYERGALIQAAINAIIRGPLN